MKNLYFLSVLSILSLFSFSIAQTNSILLKSGTGTLISSHNTIQSAYTAIPDTVTVAYIIEITAPYTAAEETFPISLGVKTGTSNANSIIIRPAANNTGEIITTSISGSGGFPLFNFDGCQFVTLDGRPGGTGSSADLTIENTSTAGTAYTIRFTNAASNNKLLYCKTVNFSNGTAGGRNIAIEATPLGSATNNLIGNCIIDGGRSTIGLASSGTGPIASDGNIIQNCVIKNWGFAGIWLLGGAMNTTISGCEMYQVTSSTSTGMTAIQLSVSGSGGTTIIQNNKIYNLFGTSTSASLAPKGIYGPAPAGAIVKIINNFISMPLDNNNAGTVYGIQLTGSTDYTAEILFNSIYIGGVHTGGTTGNVLSAGIVKGSTGAAGNWIQKNNIVINKRTGGTSGGVHTASFISTASLVGTFDVDYNNYYAAGDPGSFHAGWNSVVYNDLVQYKTAATPNEQNSKFYDVNYLSVTDLHLTSVSVGDQQLAGIPITGITTDIDGQTRNLSVPYKGADEGNISLPVELNTFAASVNNINVTLNWSTSSELNNSGFDLQRSKENSEWKSIGFVKGNGTTTKNSFYNYIDKNLQQGKYSYRLRQVDYNGSEKYYLLSSMVEIISTPEYNLAQNYPNPFNPATTISYSVAEQGQVTLKIYDVIGNEVGVLINEIKAPGNYTIQFNSNSLSSGVYFYKLSANKYTAIKKMIVLK